MQRESESKVWLDCAVSLENNFDMSFLLAGFPMGYAAAAPAYSPNMYPGANPTFQTGMCNRYIKAVTWSFDVVRTKNEEKLKGLTITQWDKFYITLNMTHKESSDKLKWV